MALEVEQFGLPEVKIIRVPRFEDQRGYLSVTYSREQFSEVGIDLEFVQENQSLSRMAGTVRGLHFQRDPFAQAKLVRVLRGRIWDVAMDIRPSSPTFRKWAATELSSETGNQIFIPVGFAHGFCTLEPDTEVGYKVSNSYSRDHELTIRWNDPVLNINWPVSEANATLSDKDRTAPLFKDVFGTSNMAAP